MATTPEQAWEVYSRADCLYTAQQVERAMDRMADAITERLRGTNPLLLSVLNGALVPAGHLLTRLDFPLEIDYLHATRYRGEIRGGELNWLARPRTPVAGRTVLVIDDIFDEGVTLAAIAAALKEEGAEVLSAVLVDKLHERKPEGFRPDFVGLTVEDRYVFGYGMDYKEYLRNVPGIFAVAD